MKTLLKAWGLLALIVMLLSGCTREGSGDLQGSRTPEATEPVRKPVPATDASEEARERREAATKLIESRKAELAVAKVRADRAIPKAKEARQKADEATEKAERDHRNYLTAKARSRVYQEYMEWDKRAALSKQEAKEAVSIAKQLEEEASQAVKALDEIQAAVRRAEEAAVR